MSDYYLPRDLIMDILLRLPIRSTVRFRCLSRSWYAPLSQRDFIYHNLIHRHSPDDDDTDLSVVRNNRDTGRKLVYSIVSAGTLVSSPIQDFPDSVMAMVTPTYSCNGLICYYYATEDGIVIVVWNPATGETKILPPLRISCLSHWTQTLGFGFDAQNNDYKIVNLTNVQIVNSAKGQLEAYVYSLKGENCWRKLGEAPDVYFYTCASPEPYLNSYKNGTFYWLAAKRGTVGGYSNETLQILSFDMTTEVFESTPIVCPPSKCFCSFFPLKESIAAVVIDDEQRFKERSFEIWALLQPGVAESWTKLYDLEWLSLTRVYRSVGFWRNHFIFQTLGGQLVLCDPSDPKHETQIIQIYEEEALPLDEAGKLQTFPPRVTIFPYKPSRILL